MPCQEVPVLEFTALQVKQTPEEHKKIMIVLSGAP